MKKNIFNIIVLAVVLLSCNKQPTASFDLPMTYTFVGDQIKFSSTSKDAVSYSWTFNDPMYPAVVNEQEASHLYTSFGNFPITLTAYSKNKKKSSSVSKTIKVYGDYHYEVNGVKYIAERNEGRGIIGPDGLTNLVYLSRLGVKKDGASNGNSGEDYLSIGLRNQISSKTKLTDAEFDELFKVGNIVNLNPKNYVQMVLTHSGVFSYEFDSTSIDNFKIINTIPYKNGLIVEANFSFTAGITTVYSVKNGYVSFRVER